MTQTAAPPRAVARPVVRIADDPPEMWDAIVSTLPGRHLFQTDAWARAKAPTGWRPWRLVLEEDGRPVAAAQALFRPLPLIGRTVCYVPRGPCVDPNDTEALAALLSALKEMARARGSILVTVDPDIPEDHPVAQATLRRQGFRPAAEQVQFRTTMLLDLARPEEEMRAALRREARYYLNVARRNGVAVEEGSPAGLPLFYRLYRETALRQRFLLRPWPYYRAVWEPLLAPDRGRLFFARHGKDTLAGALIGHFGDRAWYLYGASRNEGRELRPNHLLQWEIMRWAQQRGCTTYDLWGAPDRPGPDDPMAGVYQFKRSLGAQPQAWVGAWDYPVSRPLYFAWTVLVPRLLGAWRRASLRRVRGPLR